MKLTLEEAQNKLLKSFKNLPPVEKKRLVDEIEQRLVVENPLDKSTAQ